MNRQRPSTDLPFPLARWQKQLSMESLRRVGSPTARLTIGQRMAASTFRELENAGVIPRENAACVCGRSDGLVISHTDRFGFQSPSVWCNTCGVVRTSPRLASHWLPTFYASYYDSLYRTGAQPSPGFFSDQVDHGFAIHEFLSGLAFDRVAEIGCGAGGILFSFEKLGSTVFGCDYSPEYVSYGRQQGLKVQEGDSSVLLDERPFDLVILSHVLEHVPDPLVFLRENVIPLLADQGLIYVEMPGIRSVPLTYGDPLNYFQNAHLYNFSLTSFASLAREAGLVMLSGNETLQAVLCLEGSREVPNYTVTLEPLQDLSQVLLGFKVRHLHKGWHSFATSSAGGHVRRNGLYRVLRSKLY